MEIRTKPYVYFISSHLSPFLGRRQLVPVSDYTTGTSWAFEGACCKDYTAVELRYLGSMKLRDSVIQ